MLGEIRRTAINVGKRFVKYEEQIEELNRLRQENNELKKVSEPFGWPAGHYYSPIHSLEDLDKYEEVVKRSREKFAESIPGFSEEKMLKEFNRIKKFFSDFDYPKEDDKESRFFIKNCSYPITDSLTLFGMIRDIKPKRIIEIGSGFTSALMIDVNERFFNNKIEMTFIEPYPELLLSRINGADKKRYKIIPQKVQDVPVNEFKKLEKGDILFIDSTHVSKFNSDVNYELFDILPNIKTGVTIHFHDVFDGFEYPLQWLKDGWAWNEDYLLRAFLIGNYDYEVLMMNDYMTKRHSNLLLKSYSKFENNNGGSLWIKKLKKQ